jgi:hypothetical protein
VSKSRVPGEKQATQPRQPALGYSAKARSAVTFSSYNGIFL